MTLDIRYKELEKDREALPKQTLFVKQKKGGGNQSPSFAHNTY